ncbi:MAG: fasciclin domain-containing protein, partial [Owenweeksia sp.]
MKKLMLNLSLAVAASMMLFAAGCSKDDDNNKNTGPGNALAVAKADADLTLFAEAVEKADLSATLTGGAQITVFAPTNVVMEAYLADLNFNDIDGLITVRGKEAVKQMLSYHILEGKTEASAITKGYTKTKAQNSEGDAMDLYLNNAGSVTINGTLGAIVTEGDIQASNGVIHKINNVLQPRTITGLLEVNSDFSILAEASNKAAGNLLATLNDQQSKFTLMAPNNTAFNSFFGANATIS